MVENDKSKFEKMKFSYYFEARIIFKSNWTYWILFWRFQPCFWMTINDHRVVRSGQNDQRSMPYDVWHIIFHEIGWITIKSYLKIIWRCPVHRLLTGHDHEVVKSGQNDQRSMPYDVWHIILYEIDWITIKSYLKLLSI